VFGLRELIAVFSAVCALVLLALAAHDAFCNRSAKRLRFAALSIYGMLFAVTAIILWNREPVQKQKVYTLVPNVSDVKSAVPSDSSAVAERTAKKESTAKKTVSDTDNIAVFEPLNVKSADRSRRPPSRSDNNRKRMTNSETGSNEPGMRSVSAAWDVQVSDAVAHAFDAIELWFWRHGSPTSQANNNHGMVSADARRVTLPDINFVENTAEMTTESSRRLRQFAKELKNRPQSGEIEIQAQTDGDGPAPFQFILTQARAEVVRDFLSNEGVLNYRLIATAMSPDSEDSTTAKSQIRFVFRP
jgi:outer membrane protein OmpA-like peptidoglycan-associated protein